MSSKSLGRPGRKRRAHKPDDWRVAAVLAVLKVMRMTERELSDDEYWEVCGALATRFGELAEQPRSALYEER